MFWFGQFNSELKLIIKPRRAADLEEKHFFIWHIVHFSHQAIEPFSAS